MSAERIVEIKGIIAEMQRKIDEGLPVDRKEVIEIKIFEYREELAELERSETESQELVFDEVTEEAKPELILATVSGKPLEVYTKSEDAAFLIRFEAELTQEARDKVFEGRINELKQRNDELQEIITHKDTVIQSQAHDIDNLQDRVFEISADRDRYKDRVSVLEDNENQITLERDQALQYRDNAVKQTEDMKFEYEQMRIELNRNREVRALSEAERTAQAEEANRRFEESLIRVYNQRWEDEIKRTHYLAERAEDGVTIKYSRLEEGGHKQISEEEALNMQAMNKPVPTPPIGEVVNQEQFQSEDESLSEVQPTADGSNHESEQSPVGEIETFEQRTERRLNALEIKVNRNELEFIHDIAS